LGCEANNFIATAWEGRNIGHRGGLECVI